VGQSCKDRIAIVTGASRGIGRGIALRLASEGARLVLTGRTLAAGSHRFAGSLEETAELIRRGGGEAIAVQADLGDPGFERRTLVERAEDAFGNHVDILINNAAAPREFNHRFQDVPLLSFLTAVEVNVWAAWELAQLVVPGMRARGAGWIVNVSSRAAGPIVGPPFRSTPVGSQSLYGGTKAMLDRITTGAAMDLYDSNIAVNTLAPEAAVATENARSWLHLPESISEPEETMAEAALALATCDPKTFTARITYSLSLLVELDRPVYTLDGKALLPGWQPAEIDRNRLQRGYLTPVVQALHKERMRLGIADDA
jgi:NAD(P)-dependent dehydrogenase (short-subunit alcohol dehydrogenase family)